MVFPERFSNLPEYAFPRLRRLLDGHEPSGEPFAMSIGEPQHLFPAWVGEILADNLDGFGKYPPNNGTPELRLAISDWINRRYGVRLDADRQIMALNGTREGLFNACIALCPERTAKGDQPVVLVPNPFYQVYAAAAAAVGAEPVFVPATAETGFLPDYTTLSPETLDRAEIAYICSPSNPQGAVADEAYLTALFALAEKHDFKVFADECYSEIYQGAAPVGALEVAERTGADPERVFVFHSLSKRSNMPGLRSGFVAGGPQGMARIQQLREFAGAPLPLPLQRVAEKVWADEAHVNESRALYHEKFDMARHVFSAVQGIDIPKAGFFLWLPVEDGEQAALTLWKQTGIRVLPGSYLSRNVDGFDPGQKYIRVAMVAPKEEMQHGLKQLRDCIYS